MKGFKQCDNAKSFQNNYSKLLNYVCLPFYSKDMYFCNNLKYRIHILCVISTLDFVIVAQQIVVDKSCYFADFADCFLNDFLSIFFFSQQRFKKSNHQTAPNSIFASKYLISGCISLQSINLDQLGNLHAKLCSEADSKLNEF